MISAARIFVCVLLACIHYCAAIPRGARIDFEDCGSILEPYRIRLGSCFDIPCDLQRGSFVNIEIEFNPKDSPSQINTLRLDGFWLVDGIHHTAQFAPTYCNFVNCLTNAPNGFYELSAGVHVPDFLPRMGGLFEMRTTNYFDGYRLMCFRIPINIY